MQSRRKGAREKTGTKSAKLAPPTRVEIERKITVGKQKNVKRFFFRGRVGGGYFRKRYTVLSVFELFVASGEVYGLN
jgi:hypothetical protein